MQILDSNTSKTLLNRLHPLRPESPALWGKMNAHQMLCHLNDSFGLAMGAKTASENLTLLTRTLTRWVGLHTPMPWPHGLPTRPEMDQLVAGTKPVEFSSDRTNLTIALQTFVQQPRAFQFARHPLFGNLTEWEWLRWGYLHVDHHFRQFGL